MYLLYVSKAGRREEGGGRGGAGVLKKVQLLKISFFRHIDLSLLFYNLPWMKRLHCRNARVHNFFKERIFFRQ